MVTVALTTYLLEQARRDAETLEQQANAGADPIVQAYFNGKRAALTELREQILSGEVA